MLSGCVTANTLDKARTYTQYRICLTKEEDPPRTPVNGTFARKYVVGICSPDLYRRLDPKDNAAYDAEVARLEAEGTIIPVVHDGKPGYYALVPLTVVADVALVPVYIVYVAVHL